MPQTSPTVEHPEHSRLTLLISDTVAEAAIISRIADNSLVRHTLNLDDPAAATPVRALQKAVYDCPDILLDYPRIDILVDTPRVLLLPPDHPTDPDKLAEMFDSLYPHDELEIIATHTADPGHPNMPIVATGLPTELTGFLRRTFDRPHITHRITPLIQFFGLKNRLGNSGKLHIHLSPRRTSAIAFGNDGLLMANTYTTPTVEDALYYTLAAARLLEYNNDSDTVIISGDNTLRDALLPALRRYIANAIPAIFPAAALRAGTQAMEIPFEIAVTPLCPLP